MKYVLFVFEEFYAVEFQQARAFCGCDERAAEVIRCLKEKGIKTTGQDKGVGENKNG